MATVRLNTESITDWTSFHLACKAAMGFPDFYGMNWNAWIDCLTYIRESDGMSRFYLAPEEVLHIEITDTHGFKARLPEIIEALVEASSWVNRRCAESGQPPTISLVFL